MIKILFVCHGNICRSPMAEFMMKKMLKDKGIYNQFEIASAATSNEEIGNPVYPPARQKLAQYGIRCDGKQARRVTKSEYDQWDYIICMDQYNVRNLMRILGSDPKEKVSKLMSWTGNGRDVADPWYTGDFQTTYDDIKEGLEAFLKQLHY